MRTTLLQASWRPTGSVGASLSLCQLALCLATVLTIAGRVAAQDAEEPQAKTVTTKDGVELRLTYYPSDAGRDAVPVVLLGDFQESRSVLDPLARALNRPRRRGEESPRNKIASRAVVTVDLRGHGESKTRFDHDGGSFELDAARFRLPDFQDMVLLDMEAVRSLLVAENDAGRLNLNKLCLVGCGLGANVAVLWAAHDWDAPPLAVRKQGQDVKALVLISPRWNARGLSLAEAFKFPPIQQTLSMFVAYGAGDAGTAKDCQNIEKTLRRFHRDPPPDQRAQRQDLFVVAAQTKLQGTPLLTAPEFELTPQIAEFIELRLGAKPFPYVPRKK